MKLKIEEELLLFDLYIRTKDNTIQIIDDEVEIMSRYLKKRAEEQGILFDDKYCNVNGIKMKLRNIDFLMTQKQSGLYANSEMGSYVFDLYMSQKEEYQTQLTPLLKRYFEFGIILRNSICPKDNPKHSEANDITFPPSSIPYFDLLGVDPKEYRRIKIDDFSLSMRARKCLMIAGIYTLEGFLKLSDIKLMHLRNIREESFNELKSVLLEQRNFKDTNVILPNDISSHFTNILISLPSSIPYFDLLGVIPEEYRQINIAYFPLSVRSFNCLKKAEIYTLEDFLKLSDNKLMRLRNLGEKSFKEIRSIILEQSNFTDINDILKNGISSHFNNNSFSLPSSILYFDLLGVIPEEYRQINIADFPLSVRAHKCLKTAEIYTLEDFLKLSDIKLRCLENLGEKSFYEIKSVLLEQNNFLNIDVILQKDCPSRISYKSIGLKTRAIIEKIIEGCNVNDEEMHELSCEEIKYIEKYKYAISSIGEDVCLAMYLAPQKISPIRDMLLEFSSKYEQNKKIIGKLYEKYNYIPISRREIDLAPFIVAFKSNSRTEDFMQPNWQNLIQGCNKISDLRKAFESSLEKEKYEQLLFFMGWLAFDVNKMVKEWFDNQFERKNIAQIIRNRAAGKTLQECGDLIGITRERIRQIEAKTQLKFNLFNKNKQIIMLLYADRNGDVVITPAEIASEITNYAAELYYLLKKTSSPHYCYDENLDVFIIDPKVVGNKVQKFVDLLPDIVPEDKMNNLISSAIVEEGLSDELLYKMIEDQFKVTGTTYHRSRLTLTSMYVNVLKKYYPCGIKIYDNDEISVFKDNIKLEYGEVNLPEESRAISIRIAEIGVLYDRGKYVFSGLIDISKDLLNRIKEYIDNSDDESVLYNEIFDIFKEELLLTTNITNSYFLHGVLKQRFGEKYTFKKDSVKHTLRPMRANENLFSQRYPLACKIEEYSKNSHSTSSVDVIRESVPGASDMQREYVVTFLRMATWCEETENEVFIYSPENPIKSLDEVNEFYFSKERTRMYREFRNISDELFELAISSDVTVMALLWDSKYEEFVEICLGYGISKAGALLFIPYRNEQLVDLFYYKKLREVINKVQYWLDELSLQDNKPEASTDAILSLFWSN